MQQACSRAEKIVDRNHIIVVTKKEYTTLAKEQLPWLPDEHLLAEPVQRNTCPAAAWAVHRAMCEAGDDSIVVLMPADQLILHEDRFESDIRNGAELVAANDTILTMGATPTRTEPGYGYIQVGENNSVRSFIEKPEREFAKVLIESGEFLWNTGIYMARTGYIRHQFKQLLPYVLRDVRVSAEEENTFIMENYSRYPNMSLDLAILEKMPVRSVMHCDFGWADIGTWHSIYEAIPKDAEENVNVNTNSHIIADNAHNNVISLPDGHLAVLSGMEGYIVAQQDNVLLICPKSDSSALIRKFITQIENDNTLTTEFT